MIKLIITIIVVITLSFASSILPPKAKVHYAMDFDKDTIGLVRQQKIYKNPKWASKIELRNGKKIFFSTPKSMFEFYFRPGKWYDIGVKSEKDFKDIIVTDYKTMKLIDAKDAFYIYGSNVTSPAGDDLIAIEGKENAKIFSDTHNGSRIFRFNDVSDALIRLINGRI